MKPCHEEPTAYLGMMLFASSASAGHRFAICAVSNCVSSGSLRKILMRRHEHSAQHIRLQCQWPAEMVMMEALLSDSRRRIGGVELCESLDIF